MIAIEKAKTRLTCTPRRGECGKKTRVTKLVFHQIECYEEPSGCSGGDYYYNAKSFYWVCPKCNYINRLSSYECDSEEEKAEYQRVKALEYYFKVTKKVRR